MSEEVAAADANVREIARLRAALGQAEQRYARLARWHTRAVVALSGEAVGWESRAIAAEHAARRLVAAWRQGHARDRALTSALRGLLAEPYGCPMCDSGRLRNPDKAHCPECPYAVARAVLGE